jgi:hypothetical protein
MTEPLTLRLSFDLVDEGFHFHKLLRQELGVSSREASELDSAYAVSEPEKRFVRELLRDKRNVWLYRCHQQRFCGDFIAVDMSSGDPALRPVAVIELKEREPVRTGLEPTGQQRNAPEALAELVAAGVITAQSSIEILVGGSHEVLEWIEAWV